MEPSLLDAPSGVRFSQESVKVSKPAQKPEDTFHFRNLVVPADYHEYNLPTECIRRPGFNNTGTVVPININSYPILNIPDKTVQQYDVSAPQKVSLL